MNQQLPIKCTHSNGKICPNCSAFKMVFLLKNGFDYLKEKTPSGKLVNPVRYNFVNKNRKGLEYNVTTMLRRFENDVIYKFANVIQVYDNATGQLVAEKRF